MEATAVQRLTPDGLRRRAGAARRMLGAATTGDRVVLTAHPGAGAELVVLVHAALRDGVVPVVLDPSAPDTERAGIVADADPVAVLDPRELADGPGAAPSDGPLLGRPMHYTSGTTGRRKGVWSGVLDPAAASALWQEEVDLWRMTAADVHLVMSPLHHSAPLRFALATLLAGGTVLLPGRFSVPAFLAAARHRPTTAFTAPAQLARLRDASGADAGVARDVAAALDGFRLVAHAGAPCPEPVKRWALERLDGERVHEFYGSTEGQFTACPGTDWLARPGTVGRARPGRTLSTDADGTVWCAVPAHARFEYWRDPEKTAAAWRPTAAGPAFTVGDAGRIDGDGYLFLHGRREDLVISGGVNVYPAEVEPVLAAVPGVIEVAVFGVDDERWGQRVEAAVTGDVDPATVLAHAAEHLPPARRPKRVHVLAELPRTSTGKILRRELPDMLGS